MSPTLAEMHCGSGNGHYKEIGRNSILQETSLNSMFINRIVHSTASSTHGHRDQALLKCRQLSDSRVCHILHKVRR